MQERQPRVKATAIAIGEGYYTADINASAV